MDATSRGRSCRDATVLQSSLDRAIPTILGSVEAFPAREAALAEAKKELDQEELDVDECAKAVLALSPKDVPVFQQKFMSALLKSSKYNCLGATVPTSLAPPRGSLGATVPAALAPPRGGWRRLWWFSAVAQQQKPPQTGSPLLAPLGLEICTSVCRLTKALQLEALQGHCHAPCGTVLTKSLRTSLSAAGTKGARKEGPALQ